MKLPFPTAQTALAGAGRVVARFPCVVLVGAAGTAASISAVEAQDVMLANVIRASALGLAQMFGLRPPRERWAAGQRGAHRLPPPGMSAKLVSGSREGMRIVDKFEVKPSKAGRPTLTELEIYRLEK
jgi:hypothetical protein